MANMQKKIPFDMPTLTSGLGMGQSLGHFTAGMMLQYQGSKLPLEMLDARCRRINALMENSKAGAIYRLNETVNTSLFMEAAIRSDRFEKVASNLAHVIRKKDYGASKGDAFLYYYMEQVSADPRAEALNPRIALRLANAFDEKVHALVSTPAGVRLYPMEQEWILEKAFNLQFSENLPAERTFRELAEACLKQPERTMAGLVQLVTGFRPE